MPNNPLILVSSEIQSYYGRGIMEGICDYARDHGPWELLHVGPFSKSRNLNALKREHDGVIGPIPELLDKIKPTVNIMDRQIDNLPRVYVNDRQVAELANEHFADNGWQQVSYLGPLHATRWKRFKQVSQHRHANIIPPIAWEQYADKPWEKRHQMLRHWLWEMHTPTAILAYTDNLGAEVLEAAFALKKNVPDDIAVMGVNDDKLVCEFVSPRLSSVALAVHRVGYEAAALLDRMLKGDPIDQSPVLINPMGLVTRQSTQHMAVADRRVHDAMQFIQNHIDQPITLEKVASHVAMSPRSLQRRFSEILGRSPSEEIRRVRLEKAKRLLIETQMSLSEIAEETGYLYTTHLSKHIKQYLGCAPIAFRKRFQSDRYF